MDEAPCCGCCAALAGRQARPPAVLLSRPALRPWPPLHPAGTPGGTGYGTLPRQGMTEAEIRQLPIVVYEEPAAARAESDAAAAAAAAAAAGAALDGGDGSSGSGGALGAAQQPAGEARRGVVPGELGSGRVTRTGGVLLAVLEACRVRASLSGCDSTGRGRCSPPVGNPPACRPHQPGQRERQRQRAQGRRHAPYLCHLPGELQPRGEAAGAALPAQVRVCGAGAWPWGKRGTASSAARPAQRGCRCRPQRGEQRARRASARGRQAF